MERNATVTWYYLIDLPKPTFQKLCKKNDSFL